MEGLIKTVVGVQALARLKGKFIPIIRDWRTLGGAVPPESARPQMSRHQNTEHETPG